MTHQDRCEDSPEHRHSADRRELLRQIGAASTILALSPFAATGMMAQNPSSDLPKTIEETLVRAGRGAAPPGPDPPKPKVQRKSQQSEPRLGPAAHVRMCGSLSSNR